MRVPVVRGVIDRRILVNYRVDADVLGRLLPAPFRPMLVNGYGMAGICLIRLKHLRPRLLPAFVGVSSENAAHRIAVEWKDEGTTRHGVYVPRRDTSSWFNTLVGGRLFPGVHHHARFCAEESASQYSLVMDGDDGRVHVAVRGTVCDKLPTTSTFHSVEEASRFFACGSVGFSPGRNDGALDGLELRTFGWNMTPLEVETVESSFFEDRDRFPAGSVEFDSALLMTDIEHEWHEQHTLSAVCLADCVAPAAVPAAT